MYGLYVGTYLSKTGAGTRGPGEKARSFCFSEKALAAHTCNLLLTPGVCAPQLAAGLRDLAGGSIFLYRRRRHIAVAIMAIAIAVTIAISGKGHLPEEYCCMGLGSLLLYTETNHQHLTPYFQPTTAL